MDYCRNQAFRARFRYNNTKKYGVDKQRDLYGKVSEQVIDAYEGAKNAGKSAAEIKESMASKIKELRGKYSKIFRHVGYDKSKLNVIDINPRSIPKKHQSSFEEACENDKRIDTFLMPPKDPAYHLEIPQPSG